MISNLGVSLNRKARCIYALMKGGPTSGAKTSSVRARNAVVQRGLSKIQDIEYDSHGIDLLVQRRDTPLLIYPPGN